MSLLHCSILFNMQEQTFRVKDTHGVGGSPLFKSNHNQGPAATAQ